MAQTYLVDYCKTYLPPIKALKMFHILLLQSSSKPTCRILTSENYERICLNK